MFLTKLNSNILLCISVSAFATSVLCADGKSTHGSRKARNQNHQHLNKTTKDVHATKRDVPTELTPKGDDTLLLYVCEHNRKLVECAENTVIRVLKANYGRTDLKTCDLDPENKWSVKCVNNNKTEEVLIKKCNGKNACEVQASNSVFGDPCRGTIKYLEVKYLCTPGSKPISTHVCEHSNLHIKCDVGKVIQILEANYGRTTLEKCSSYNSDWNFNCKSNKSEEIIRKKCEQKRSCDIEAYNSVFGDPCRGTMKYVEIQFDCLPIENQMNTDSSRISTISPSFTIGTNDTVSLYVCEDKKKRVECQQDSVIHLLKAYYGRTSLKPCGAICVNNKTKEIVKKQCDGKRSCDIEASNSVFGDPCYGTIKYLEVKYLCKPDNKPISAHVCENSNLHMMCDAGKGIHILEANYGRTTVEKCPYNLGWNLSCKSNISEGIIRQKCDQKRACDVEAGHSIFGDPCYGTLKYVEMQYYCAQVEEKGITHSTKTPNKSMNTPTTTSNRTNETISLYVCEDKKKRVECQQDSVIHLLKAYYGRTSLTPCGGICVNNKTKEIVKKQCDGKRSCDVKASNSVFGDPCYGTIKYLEVKYLCTPDNKPISSHVCENSNLHMMCDATKVINVLEANYGRTTLEKCPYNLGWNLNCKSNISEGIIRQKCDQKRECDVAADNSIFGDPCYGTLKYLEMQYYCAQNEEKVITDSSRTSITSTNTPTTSSYRRTISMSEDTEMPYSTNSLTNTIYYSDTEYPTSVSPHTQAIPITVNGVPNSGFDETQTYYSHNHRTEYLTPSAVSENPSITDSEKPTIPITDSSFTTATSEKPRTDTDITETMSDIPQTHVDISTDDFELITAISPEEIHSQKASESATESTIKTCGNYDLNCMKFKCPRAFGSHVHPNTRKMFIVCINWKPMVKTCEVGLVLSLKHMKCVSKDHWWSKWGDYVP